MHAVRRTEIPPRGVILPALPALARHRRTPKAGEPYPTEYGYTALLKSFLASDARVWEIGYDCDIHTVNTTAESFAQAKRRMGLGTSVLVARRGDAVFLARPDWRDYAPHIPPARVRTGVARALRRETVEGILLYFVASGESSRVVDIPPTFTPAQMYAALQYKRTRLGVNASVSLDNKTGTITLERTDR